MGDRAEAHRLRVEVEALVTRSRGEVTAEMRRAEAEGRLGSLTVQTLQTVLDRALTAVCGSV